MLYYTIISEKIRTKKMPFSVKKKKNVLIVGQSHIDIYGRDESEKDVIHEQKPSC